MWLALIVGGRMIRFLAVMGAAPLKDHQTNGDRQKAKPSVEQGFWFALRAHLHLLEGGHALQVEDGHNQNQKAGKGAFQLMEVVKPQAPRHRNVPHGQTDHSSGNDLAR